MDDVSDDEEGDMSSDSSTEFPPLGELPEDPKAPPTDPGDTETDPESNPDGYMGGADIKE